METDITGELILIGLLILLNSFFAASEIAIISSRKARIRKLSEEGDRSAQLVESLFENSSRFLATIQVGITVAGFFAAALGAVASARLLGRLLAGVPVGFVAQEGPAIALIIVTLAIAFLTIVVGELVPKSLALQHAETIALFVARPIDLLARIATPIVSVITFFSDILVFLLGGGRKTRMPFVTEEEIRTLVDAGEEEGVLHENEKDMIYGIFDLEQKNVHEIMVPRIDMVALEAQATFQEALEAVVKRGLSRIPLYEGSVDNVVGILYAKDLLRRLAAGEPYPALREIARPPFFVPESKRISDLLKELQKGRVHMAIVLDEYGGTAGLVTIEDLLEEIVGEIQDEYDREEPQIEQINPDEAILDGRVSIDDLNEIFELEIKGEEFDTVGGFVFHQLGKIPVAGDRVQLDNLSLEVLSTTGRRINKIKAIRQPAASKRPGPTNGNNSK